MKHLILFSVAALSLTACRNDDDNSSTEPSIVGTWKLSKGNVYDGKTNKLIETDTYDECESKSNTTLSADGKSITQDYELDTNNQCVYETISGTYSYNAATKKLVSTINGEKDESTVRNLTSTELEVDNSERIDINGDGVQDIITVVFTRVK